MRYRRRIIDEVNAALPVIAIGLGILDVVLFLTLRMPAVAEDAGCAAVPNAGTSCTDVMPAHGILQRPGPVAAAARVSVRAVR